MAAPLRFGRFEFQVRLVLILLVLFLAVLDLLNLYLLGEAKHALERSEREQARTRIGDLVDSLGADLLVEAVRSGPARTRLSSTVLRRASDRFGYDRLALLDRAGREVVSSGPSTGFFVSTYEDLSPGALAALAAGREVTGEMRPGGGGRDARLTAFTPLLDSAGRLLGVVGAVQPVPELGRLEGNYRLVLAVQIVGMLVIAGLAVLFANWVSRPYRKLADAAGEAGLTTRASDTAPDPDELATAFRTVVAKLKEQDEALGSLRQEGGSLGDLVRFASKAASGMVTGVLVVDRQGQVAAINPSAARLLGCVPEEARGRPLDRVARKVRGLRSQVRACLSKGISVSREVLEVREEDGRIGHLGVSISPAAGWDGEAAGALVLMTDLTEIRQLQEQAHLRENLAAVGKLSAGIAHEFRNALGTILGYARMLEKREDPMVRGPAREILKEIDSVRAAVDEFLLYAKPPEPAQLPVSVESVIRGCAAAVDEALMVEVDGEFGEILADEGLLRRAFDNLLHNAAEASETGTVRVRITGRRVATDRILQVDVEDDGPGIPPEMRDQVFLPFFTTRARGTGLGLALVQRTIVDLGGSIDVAQGGAGGALFRLRIPLMGESRISA